MEREYLFVVIAGILSGLIVFGVQIFANLGLSLYQISVFHAIFMLILLPFVLFKKECRIKRGMLKFFLIFGFLSSLTNFTEFGPIILGVPVAVVILLLYTQPLWTTILGRILLKEEITRNKILAVLLVLAGITILVNPFTESFTLNIIGISLALMGGVLFSTWVIFGRVSGIKRYHPITTQFGRYVFMLIFLLMSYPIITLFIKDASIINLSVSLPAEIWLYLLLFTVFAITIPHLLYFQGAKRIPASDAGIILLLEPVSASVLAMLFLQQPITLNILFGGALILISNYLVLRRGAKPDSELKI
jgi:DME family drug/metabolite transporter